MSLSQTAREANSCVRLSDVFDTGEIAGNAEFETLGQSDSSHANTLAYCDSIFHLRRADANPNVSSLVSTAELIALAKNTQGLVVASNPRLRFFQLHERLYRDQLLQPQTIGSIGEHCDIHPTAVISAYSVIGDNVTIGANVVVHDHVSIGPHTFVDSGAQIGVDGLLYYTDQVGNKHHVRHQGGVSIGHHCALLCNSVVVKSVHKGLLTTVKDHCVIGVASNIGHEAQIASNVVISNHCVVARAATLENNCHVGTSSVIREYVQLAEGAVVKPGSIVIDNVAAGEVVSGNYAINHKKHVRQYLESRQ